MGGARTRYEIALAQLAAGKKVDRQHLGQLAQNAEDERRFEERRATMPGRQSIVPSMSTFPEPVDHDIDLGILRDGDTQEPSNDPLAEIHSQTDGIYFSDEDREHEALMRRVMTDEHRIEGSIGHCVDYVKLCAGPRPDNEEDAEFWAEMDSAKFSTFLSNECIWASHLLYTRPDLARQVAPLVLKDPFIADDPVLLAKVRRALRL